MRVRCLSTCKLTSQPVLFHGKDKRPRGQTQRTSLVTAQQVGYFTFRLVTLVLKFSLRLGMTEVKGNAALFAGDSSLGDPNRPSKPAYPSPQRETVICYLRHRSSLFSSWRVVLPPVFCADILDKDNLWKRAVSASARQSDRRLKPRGLAPRLQALTCSALIHVPLAVLPTLSLFLPSEFEDDFV